MIRRVKDVVDSEIDGQTMRYGWRKNPTQTTAAGIWFDLAMSPGNPAPKYWFDSTPYEARSISATDDGGLFHGISVPSKTKYIRKFSIIPNSVAYLPMTIVLCDYLLYYPSIEESTTDAQLLDNTITLPRYQDGEGVQIMAVNIAARTGGQDFYLSYTNSKGVSGRTTPTVRQGTANAIGSIVTSSTSTINCVGPFIPLQSEDTGVRSVDSVTFLGTDVGLFSILLVKPLCSINVRELAPVEKDFLINDALLPIVEDDAYLNMICMPNGSLASVAIFGDMQITWN